MKYNTFSRKNINSILVIFDFLWRLIKNITKLLRYIFIPKLILTINKVNDFLTCGLKYKFQYYYGLDEILTKEYPQGLIGQLVHQYIYLVMNKGINFDVNYITELIMEKVYEKFIDLSLEDKEFYQKDVKNMLINFYSWYLNNKNKIYAVNYDISVVYQRSYLKVKCDCILKNSDEYEVVDFVTTKRNISAEMLSYDFNSNFQYFVLSQFFTKKNKKFKFTKVFLLYNNIASFSEEWSMQKEVEKTVDKVYQQIKNKEFEIHKGPLCGWCGYYDICPGWKIEREGDKDKGILPVAADTTLFRVARETRGRMALSYSKMSMYLQCPRRYRLCYLDRAGVRPRSFFSIGSTIHNTLELFYKIKPEKNTKEPSLQQLLDLYNTCWISSGYKSIEEEQEYYKKGKEWLINYYEKFVKGKYIPAYLTEEYFELPIGDNTHVMIGYIDRVQRNTDGSFEIIDYKTDPKIRTQEEVDKDLQLTIYYWGLKNKGIEAKRLSLVFIRFGEIIYTTRTQKNIEELDNYVKQIADQMWSDGEKYVNLKKEYQNKNTQLTEDKIEEIFPSKINKYCGGCDYLTGCPKEEIIKTEYKDKLLFQVSESGEILDKEIEEELKSIQEVSTEQEKKK
ncbi:MAG: PD-(D/E)XK nuclease family protein [Endomicrobia bacterium]|nr:PD-(D/E)XK nuclease family protein [Endomicrobiia bacterium]